MGIDNTPPERIRIILIKGATGAPATPVSLGLQPVYRGANWNDDSNNGAFYLNGNNDFDNANNNIGARLGYLHRQTKKHRLGHPPWMGK